MTVVRIKSAVSNPVEKSDGTPRPFIALEDIEKGTGRLLTSQLAVKAAGDSVAHRAGDVLFSKLRPYLAKSYIATEAGTATGELLVLRPGPRIASEFLFYLTLSRPWIEWATTTAYGSKMPRTSWELVAEHRAWLPSVEEQRRIAGFLDAETAHIDRLAGDYGKLKALFIERHQRVIDSNFEPIEDTTIPLKYMVRFIEGPGIMAEDFRSSGVPLVRLRGLKDGNVTLTGCNYLDAAMVAKRWSKFALRLGDRVISGSATMGEVSSVTSPEVVGAIPYTGLIILRPTSPEVDMDYVECFLQSSSFFKQIDALKAGAAMQHFGPTHLAQIRMPLPDMGTQLQISKEVKRATSQMQQMRDLVDRQLSLLAERRQALITAAVTGEFDVSTASGRGVAE